MPPARLGAGPRHRLDHLDVRPLVRRNAYFNLVKLGARATDYLPDCYGPMHDGLNRGEASDRLFVEWDLLSPPPSGRPRATIGR